MLFTHPHDVIHHAIFKLACVGVLMSASFASVSACAAHDDRFKQSFSRNRAATLARSAILAKETSAQAVQTLDQAFIDMDAALAASDPAAVYEDSRRIRSRYESNAKLAIDRIKNVETVAQELLTVWAAESGRLADPARKAATRADLANFKATYEPVKKSSRKLQEALAKPTPILADDVLYIKYRRLSQSTLESNPTHATPSSSLPPPIVNMAKRQEVNQQVQEANARLQQDLDALIKRLDYPHGDDQLLSGEEPMREPTGEASRLMP